MADITTSITNFQEISGSESPEFSETLINQLLRTLWKDSAANEDAKNIQINAALIAMMDIKPADAIEGMMAAQIVATHNAAMACFYGAVMKGQNWEGRKDSLNQANKLTRSCTTLIDALNRYRGKGISEQKVTVQHVYVSEGGQAIVGNVKQVKE